MVKIPKLSLRWILSLPFVLQTLVTVGLVGYLSYRSGKASVENLTQNLMLETGEHIHNYLNSYLQFAQKVNQANRDLLQSKIIDEKDFESLGRLFWQQIKNYDFTYITFGNQKREFIGSGYVTGAIDIGEVKFPNLNTLYSYSVNNQGDRLPHPLILENANPNDEAWYGTAIKEGKPTWSPVYNWIGAAEEISISASAPLYNSSKQFMGVVGIDLSLSRISHFLRGLKVGKSGEVFILDRAGFLVASSTSQNPYQLINGKAERVRFQDIQNPFVKTINQAIQKKLGNENSAKIIPNQKVEILDQDPLILIQPYRDQYGLEWSMIIAIPQSDYMAEIQANNYRTLLLCILALLVSSIIGILIANRITQPIKRLSRASQLLAEGDNWQLELPKTENIIELNRLAQSFNQMAQEIQTSQTNLQLTLTKLENSNQQLQQFLDAIPVGIIIHNPDGVAIYFNQVAKEILGQGIQEGVTAEAMAIDFQPYRENTDEVYPVDQLPVIRALQGEGSHLDDLELLIGNKRIPLEVFGTPVYDDSGAITYAIMAFQDISLTKHREAEQKKVEMQLQQTNEELIRANRLKDEFLATMSHELRTPLTAVLGMTQGLQEEVFGEINPKQRKALQTIESSGSHLLSLINDILDLAKIGSSQVEIDVASVAVAPLCQSSLLLIRPQAFQKNIQIETKLPTHLPHLLVDERRIRQVLINLLNNAVKFTPEGGYISLEVSIPSLNTSLPFLRLAVKDTGIGISPENIDKLFQPFIQIDSALNRKYEGTGLGLALVKRIVELHGGQVGLTSTLGKGSCFTIDLPCTSVPISTASIESSLTNLDGSPDVLVPLSSPLILLVEDNKANRLTFSAYLKAKGYRLIEAEDGETAIALAQSEQPDLILMDIQIPGMDGLEVIKHLRHDPQFLDKPIIALTALATDSDRDRCLATGANNYLSKPVKMKELIVIIQQFL